ncbi:MAG: hypothetical protein QOJ81_1994 [Chloroflexota bacterium]|nr:hypothetical protein [Chloroflexota bacterium]
MVAVGFGDALAVATSVGKELGVPTGVGDALVDAVCSGDPLVDADGDAGGLVAVGAQPVRRATAATRAKNAAERRVHASAMAATRWILSGRSPKS